MTADEDAPVKPKILIVDDSPENLRILMEALGKRYAISATKSGPKALEAARRSPRPDMILLDIMMPGMDGYEVCRRLKEDPATREIPILFITALADVESEMRGFQLGALDYIHKPFSAPVVQARVKNHLELAQNRRQLAEQNRSLEEAARLRDDVDSITRHDLKGPLHAVIGMPQLMLEDENLTEEQRDCLEHIEKSGFQMLDQINRSLDLYKMERGTYQYRPQAVDLISVLQRTLKSMSSLVEAWGLTVAFKVDGAPFGEASLWVAGEEFLALSLFSNLVKNAIEASPEGGELTIDLFHDDGAPQAVIHNRGVVPEAVRDRFFDKFITQGKDHGTGLGTYSSKLMADTQGWGLAMETSEATGTTLTLTFPGEAPEKA